MSPPPAEQFAARIFMGPVLRAQPDRRLVDLVRDGYDAAFEEIVRRYRKPLDRFAAGIVGGRSEDVTQDAFSKALRALRGSEAEIELRPWLYRIVRNTALNDLRDLAPMAEELSERLPGARSAAAEVEAREELRELMDRLQALPEPQRAALVMRELEGLSHEEIAAALGVSGGAARQAIYRARAALREGLGLLLPLPALRMFAEHSAEMVKAGAATVLIAGTVGAGVAIDHHRGERVGPEAADAAPLVTGRKHRDANETSATSSSSSSAGNDRSSSDSSSGHGSSHENGGSLSGGTRSGSEQASGGGPGPSGPGGGSHSGGGAHSGGDSSHSGSGSSGGSGGNEGSGDRHGGSSNDGTSGGSSGEDGGISGGSGSDEGLSGGDGGSGSGEIESEPTASEPALTESTEGGDAGTESSGGESSDSSSSGSGSGSGSDDFTSTTTGGSDESP